MEVVKTIEGFDIFVSDEDYGYCNQIKWKITKIGYVYGLNNGYLHRLVLIRQGVIIPEGMVIDHIDRNKLNNRRENLRVITQAQNMINKSKKSEGKYRGVTCHGANKYNAIITINGQRKNLGSFKSALEAAKAYDRAAIALHGPFAVLNFSDEKY